MVTFSRENSCESLDERLEELRPQLDAVDLDNLPSDVTHGIAIASSNGDGLTLSDDQLRVTVLFSLGVLTTEETLQLSMHIIDRRHVS